jgi:hypothetical protein
VEDGTTPKKGKYQPPQACSELFGLEDRDDKMSFMNEVPLKEESGSESGEETE